MVSFLNDNKFIGRTYRYFFKQMIINSRHFGCLAAH